MSIFVAIKNTSTSITIQILLISILVFVKTVMRIRGSSWYKATNMHSFFNLNQSSEWISLNTQEKDWTHYWSSFETWRNLMRKEHPEQEIYSHSTVNIDDQFHALHTGTDYIQSE